MKILAFDTTSVYGSAAVLEADQLLGEVCLAGLSSHSVRLLRQVDFLLQQFSLSIQDIEAYAVAAGPGSFTGIRVGLSTVKALARASGKPVAPVSALRALAYKIRENTEQPLAAMIDAKKAEVFAALYKVSQGNWVELIAEGAYRPLDFLALLPQKGKVWFIGSGVEAYKKEIQAVFGGRALLASRSFFLAAEVGVLGWQLLQQGKGLKADEVEPIYYRPSQAEEKRLSVGKEKKTL